MTAVRLRSGRGSRKGYVPVYGTDTNLNVSHGDTFARPGVPELSLAELRDDRPLMTCMFQGFDGTLFLDGPKELYWQHLPIDHESIQLLPKFLRRYQSTLPKEMRALRALWIAYYLARRREHWPVLKDKIVRRFRNEKPPSRKF